VVAYHAAVKQEQESQHSGSAASDHDDQYGGIGSKQKEIGAHGESNPESFTTFLLKDSGPEFKRQAQAFDCGYRGRSVCVQPKCIQQGDNCTFAISM
jgi:hypothetical protein